MYYGFAASTYINSTNPTPGSQCLPANYKQIHYYNDSASVFGNTEVYRTHGMEYDTFVPGQDDIKGVACALCKVSTRSTLLMIPATHLCNSTSPTDNSWTREYNGYLMLVRGAGSQYYCVDATMQRIGSSQTTPGTATFVHVVTGEDPPHDSIYDDKKVLSCVVCTI